MSIRGYPDFYAPQDADYVLTTLDADLANGRQLVPGPGIAIIISGNQVTIETSGGGAGTTASYITRNDERVDLPNSIRLRQGANMVFTYDDINGTLTLSSTASGGGGGGGSGAETFLTINDESGTLTNSRRYLAGSNVFITDNGAGSTYVVQTEASITETNGTYSLTSTSKRVHLANAVSGSITYNLPAASSNTDKTYTIKKTDASANTVTLTPNGSDKIDTAASYVLTIPNQSATIVSNGSGWWIL